jgi:hypothetical protein
MERIQIVKYRGDERGLCFFDLVSIVVVEVDGSEGFQVADGSCEFKTVEFGFVFGLLFVVAVAIAIAVAIADDGLVIAADLAPVIMIGVGIFGIDGPTRTCMG